MIMEVPPITPRKTHPKKNDVSTGLEDEVVDLGDTKISSSFVSALADLLIADMSLDVDIQRKIATPKKAA